MKKSRDWGSSTKHNLVAKEISKEDNPEGQFRKNVKHKNSIILSIHGKYILLSIVPNPPLSVA